MPFKITFSIYEGGKAAPCFTTTDKHYARVEYNERVKKDPWTRLTFDIECIDLTQHEKYVWLVYRVRKAIHKFFNNGRSQEDMKASLKLEEELDQWNARTRMYLNGHPNAMIDEKAKAFFIIVEAWRVKWHKYFACKKNKAVEEAVIKEMKKECFDYEDKIDKYVKQVIGLI